MPLKPFMPTAFKGTSDPKGLTVEQNDGLASRLRAAPSPAPPRTVAAPSPAPLPPALAKPRTVAALPAPPSWTPAQPLPPPGTSTTEGFLVDLGRREAATEAQRQVAEAQQETSTIRRELREAKWVAESAKAEIADARSEAQAEVAAARREMEKARQQLAQETARREAAEARRVVTPGRKSGGAVRVATHEKLTPKLIAFPPVLLARLEALSLAYGLDQTATVRMAVTTQYEHAVKAGTINL